MSLPLPPDDQDATYQILSEFLADWTPEELDDARRAVELDEEERDR